MEVAGEVCARRGSGGGWVVVLRGAEGGDDCRLGLSGWGESKGAGERGILRPEQTKQPREGMAVSGEEDGERQGRPLEMGQGRDLDQLVTEVLVVPRGFCIPPDQWIQQNSRNP